MLGKIEYILFLKNRKIFTQVNWLVILGLSKQTPFSEISQNFLTDDSIYRTKSDNPPKNLEWIDKRLSPQSID